MHVLTRWIHIECRLSTSGSVQHTCVPVATKLCYNGLLMDSDTNCCVLMYAPCSNIDCELYGNPLQSHFHVIQLVASLSNDVVSHSVQLAFQAVGGWLFWVAWEQCLLNKMYRSSSVLYSYAQYNTNVLAPEEIERNPRFCYTDTVQSDPHA
jgi:hypothetical protein